MPGAVKKGAIPFDGDATATAKIAIAKSFQSQGAESSSSRKRSPSTSTSHWFLFFHESTDKIIANEIFAKTARYCTVAQARPQDAIPI